MNFPDPSRKEERLAALGQVAFCDLSLPSGIAPFRHRWQHFFATLKGWGWVPGVKSEKVKHRDHRGDPQLSPHAKILKICSANSLKNGNMYVCLLS